MMVVGANPLGCFLFGQNSAQNAPMGCVPLSAIFAACQGVFKADWSSKPSVGNCQNRYPSPKGWSALPQKQRPPFSLKCGPISLISVSEAKNAHINAQAMTCAAQQKGKSRCKSNHGFSQPVQQPRCPAVSQQTQTLTMPLSVRLLARPPQWFWTAIRWLALSPVQALVRCVTTRAFVAKPKNSAVSTAQLTLNPWRSCGEKVAKAKGLPVGHVPFPKGKAKPTWGDTTSKSEGSLCDHLLYSGQFWQVLLSLAAAGHKRPCPQKHNSSQQCWSFRSLTNCGDAQARVNFFVFNRNIAELVMLRLHEAAALSERVVFRRLLFSKKRIAHV